MRASKNCKGSATNSDLRNNSWKEKIVFAFLGSTERLKTDNGSRIKQGKEF